MDYEPNELQTQDSVSIKTNDDLNYLRKTGKTLVRFRGKLIELNPEDRIMYDGHFVTDRKPRAWSN